MDRFENGLSKEDNIDSWDIISDECCDDDMQDYEIIKHIHEPVSASLEKELTTNNHTKSSTKKTNALPKNANTTTTFTTDDSGETSDDDYEDIKKCKQDIKKENTTFVDVNASKLSTKKEHKFKRKQTIQEPKTILKKKDENIQNINNNKNKFKKSIKKSRTLLNSANLGALLTAFGLSLIFLNTSDKTQTTNTEQETKNLSNNLLNALNNTTLRENIIDEEQLIEKFLPANVNKSLLEQKSLKTKILKRIDRKIKHQIRGCDIKPLKKEKKSTKTKTIKNELIGPLQQDNEFYANNSSTTSSKPISYRDAVLSCKNNKANDSGSSTTPPELIMDYDMTKTKADMMNKFLDNDVKNFTETTLNLEELIPEKMKKKPNCSSIYRDFIKAEMLFKKILNNSYDIPKPKTPTDLAYNIENKINVLTADNISLSNIIEEQEHLLKQIQEKIAYKKEILQKRSQQKNILLKRLKFANWMKQKREDDEKLLPKNNLAKRILNNIVLQNTTNNKNSKSSTEIATRYPLPISEEKYKSKNAEDAALYVRKKVYLIKKQEDLQRNMETKKRKDEEHLIRVTKLVPEKCDPKRAWTKKVEL